MSQQIQHFKDILVWRAFHSYRLLVGRQISFGSDMTHFYGENRYVVKNSSCKYTNRKITDESYKYDGPANFAGHTGKPEIKASLGLFYLEFLNQPTKMPTVSGLLMARDKTMSQKSFHFSLSVLRFHDLDTKEARKSEDDKTFRFKLCLNSF